MENIVVSVLQYTLGFFFKKFYFSAFQKKGPMPGMCVRLIQTLGILSAFKGGRDLQSSLDGAIKPCSGY